MTTKTLKSLKIPSSPSQIKEVEAYVRRVAKEYNISPEVFPNILISLTEAVNNAIIHGNNKDESKFVNINCKEHSDSLVFEICDEGSGFNPNKIADPTAVDNLDCCGGRGVFIMKELADEIDFLDNGRRVKICFKHHCA